MNAPTPPKPGDTLILHLIGRQPIPCKVKQVDEQGRVTVEDPFGNVSQFRRPRSLNDHNHPDYKPGAWIGCGRHHPGRLERPAPNANLQVMLEQARAEHQQLTGRS